MSYKSENGQDTIICDKCGTSEKAPESEAGKRFFRRGWGANFDARKYVHLCYDCQSKKQKEATDWARQRF